MESDIFVFDESSQKHIYDTETLDRLLRELHGFYKPFGGKHVIMGGDHGQCLPIVEKASRMSFKKCDLWNEFKKNKHKKNERCADEISKKIIIGGKIR